MGCEPRTNNFVTRTQVIPIFIVLLSDLRYCLGLRKKLILMELSQVIAGQVIVEPCSLLFPGIGRAKKGFEQGVVMNHTGMNNPAMKC